VGLALVALAFLMTDALLWEPGVTEANVRHIRIGMTRDQVRAIMGREPDNAPRCFQWEGCFRPYLYWQGEYGRVELGDEEDGRVIEVNWIPTAGRNAGQSKGGLLHSLRAWLGW